MANSDDHNAFHDAHGDSSIISVRASQVFEGLPSRSPFIVFPRCFFSSLFASLSAVVNLRPMFTDRQIVTHADSGPRGVRPQGDHHGQSHDRPSVRPDHPPALPTGHGRGFQAAPEAAPPEEHVFQGPDHAYRPGPVDPLGNRDTTKGAVLRARLAAEGYPRG